MPIYAPQPADPMPRPVEGETDDPVGFAVFALGAVASITGVVKVETLEQMIRKRFKGAAVEMNLKVLAAGRELAGR